MRSPPAPHELVIGHHDHDGHDHSHGHDHEHGKCDHEHHHHHGNENELDVVVMPVKLTANGDFTTPAAQAAIATATRRSRARFRRLGSPSQSAGDTVVPGATLHRLLLNEGNGKFVLKLNEPGFYLVFEACGEHPLHIQVMGEISRSPCWQQDYHAAHTHNDAVTRVGISTPGDLDGKKLNDWISELLRVKGGDIYRMKGVLAVKGSNKRLVFQGVHMLFDAKFDREWTDNRAPHQHPRLHRQKPRPHCAHRSLQACLV
jgi:G3E family GTPase